MVEVVPRLVGAERTDWRRAVAADWRIELQKQIRKIHDTGGLSPSGELIHISADLGEPDYEKFVAFAGRLNDLPFGDARAGTLEIHSVARQKDGSAQISFLYRPQPPVDFGSSSGLMRPAGPGGEYRRVILGIDFNNLPGLVFPTERNELKGIKAGRRNEAVVPIPHKISLAKGDRVTFFEATADAFGTPVFKADAEPVSVTLTEVRDEDYEWAGKRLHYIAWDPSELRREKGGDKSRA